MSAITEQVDRARHATEVGTRRAVDSHVYFVQVGRDGPIKIGRAIDVEGRVKALQTASAWPLRLLAVVVYAGPALEARLHRLFANDRLTGEWFRPSQLLREVIVDFGGVA